MTLAELFAALAAQPDLDAPALLLLDGELMRVRSVTSTTLEPRPDLPAGCAVIRVERA